MYSRIQGDEHDSSDEEWDTHIGRHARAFLGLNEPVVEIALDDGVGIGMMVRNAFQRADDIHIQAAVADSSSTGGSDAEPMHPQPVGDGEPDGVNNSNVGNQVGEIVASHRDPLITPARHTDMRSSSTSGPGPNLFETADSHTQEAFGSAQGTGIGVPSEEEGLFGMQQDGDPEDGSGDSSSEDDWNASSDNSSEAEDVEDLLGEIPNDRMGSNP